MALEILQEMTVCLAEARERDLISPQIQVSLDHNTQLLMDYLGGCERIRRTPLPFALVETTQWIPVALVTYIFLGIEEIRAEIEGSFGYDDNDLPLEQICDTIQKNVAQIAELRFDEAWPRPAKEESEEP